MRAVLRENVAEALIGVLVIALAVWFVIFAWGRTGGGEAGGYQVTALFPNAAGVTVGTEVRIAGMKVGTVSGERLDPKSYQAEVTMALDPTIKIPSDSSAAIGSDGLLGGANVTLTPGGSPTPLKSGDTIIDTQGSLDLMSLIGSFINKSGGTAGGSAGGDAGKSGGGDTPATP